MLLLMTSTSHLALIPVSCCKWMEGENREQIGWKGIEKSREVDLGKI